jgi:hypothetical protein
VRRARREFSEGGEIKEQSRSILARYALKHIFRCIRLKFCLRFIWNPCVSSEFSQQVKELYLGDQTWRQKPNRQIGESVA